jgi:threonine dehydrogenase-like Zn-dependent dehydrogenase
LKGTSTIIGVDSDPVRLKMAKQMGADEVIDHSKTDAVKRKSFV